MGRSKMKNLYESLLDNDEELFDRTDIMKDFPKKSRVGHSDWHDDYRIWYYRWKNCQLPMELIDGYHHLYITWYSKDNKNYLIRLKGSDSDFFNSQEICSPYITMESNNEKQVRKQAYEIFRNIASNLNILDYLHDNYNKIAQIPFHTYHLEVFPITVDELKKEFKDTWQEIKK